MHDNSISKYLEAIKSSIPSYHVYQCLEDVEWNNKLISLYLRDKVSELDNMLNALSEGRLIRGDISIELNMITTLLGRLLELSNNIRDFKPSKIDSSVFNKLVEYDYRIIVIINRCLFLISKPYRYPIDLVIRLKMVREALNKLFDIVRSRYEFLKLKSKSS